MRTDHTRAVTAHYDERAAAYDDSPMHRGLAEVVADLPELADAEAVLDAATGTGLVLRALAARRPGQRLTGVDLSPAMLAVGRRELAGATFLLADASRVPLDNTSVDAITCVTALHLFDHPGAVFAEWTRVLRPGGIVVTASFAPLETAAASTHGDSFVRRHEAYRSPQLVADALAPYGFGPVRHTRWSSADDHLLICLLRR
jgi:ubiquinone/menaquinone biosynthesis C-methylase UbiE